MRAYFFKVDSTGRAEKVPIQPRKDLLPFLPIVLYVTNNGHEKEADGGDDPAAEGPAAASIKSFSG